MDALDASRKDYASNLFNAARDVMTGQTTPETAEPHSDPKPEVEPFTQLLLKMRCNNAFQQDSKEENKNALTVSSIVVMLADTSITIDTYTCTKRQNCC